MNIGSPEELKRTGMGVLELHPRFEGLSVPLEHSKLSLEAVATRLEAIATSS